MMATNYQMLAVWSGRVETPAAIGETFLRTLDSLARIDPVFSDWGAGYHDDPRGLSVEAVRDHIAAIVADNVKLDDYDEPDPEDGYEMAASTRFSTDTDLGPKSFSFYVGAGSKWSNRCVLEAGSMRCKPDPSIVTYPAFKAALLTLIAIWPSVWAVARAFVGGDWKPPTEPGEPPFPPGSMPWIAYLCAERSADLRPPSYVTTERTPDGGLLMIAAEERFDPTNLKHLKPSRWIAELMEERGSEPSW